MAGGRTKVIKSEEEMMDLFDEYALETKSNPRQKREYVGKDGDAVDKPLERPLTLVGFCNFMRRKKNLHVHHYFENTDKAYEEFRGVCRMIRDEIRQDQIEGGMVNLYNPSITQRLNNLKESTDHNIKMEQPLFPDDSE